MSGRARSSPGPREAGRRLRWGERGPPQEPRRHLTPPPRPHRDHPGGGAGRRPHPWPHCRRRPQASGHLPSGYEDALLPHIQDPPGERGPLGARRPGGPVSEARGREGPGWTMDRGAAPPPRPPDTTVSPLAFPPRKRGLSSCTALGPGPPMSLQGRVSPPSSEGRALPSPVPLGSGMGAGVDPHGLTGQDQAARPHPPAQACIRPSGRGGLRGRDAWAHAPRWLMPAGPQGAKKQGLRLPPALGSESAEWVLAPHCFYKRTLGSAC